MKKIKLLVVALLTIILLPFNINAAEKDQINVYIFKGDGCGYCAAALEFFESIESEYGAYFDLVEREVWYDEDNATLMSEVAAYFGEEVSGVPYIVIGDKTSQGYAETYNKDIIAAIEESYNSDDYTDAVEEVQGGTSSKSSDKKDNGDKTTIIIIAVALIGFVALFYFARDPKEIEDAEKIEETKVVEEPIKEEVKKATPAKKTTTKKSTTTKSTTVEKSSTTKASTSKKTTTKKAPAKKTTNKTSKK